MLINHCALDRAVLPFTRYFKLSVYAPDVTGTENEVAEFIVDQDDGFVLSSCVFRYQSTLGP